MPIFPTWYTNWTPASDDRIMFSDTSASNQTKDCAISEIPISIATQTALDTKVDNVIAWTNTTVSRSGNTITVNSLWWPAVVTNWFNRNYFVATEWQTDFTANFDFAENTSSVIVALNWQILKPTLDYTEPWLNKVVFVSWLNAWDEVQLLTGIKWEKGDTWNWISTITRTSWTWAPWTTDTYTITFTDTTTTTFQVYNWANWVWAWDMLKSENLSWLANYATARANLWLWSAAQSNTADLLNRANHTWTQAFETITEVEFTSPVTVWQSLVYDWTNWINANPTPAVWSAKKLYLDPTATIADNLYLNTSPPSFPQQTKKSTVDADIGWWLWFLERFVSWPLWRTDISAWDWIFNIYASTLNNTWTDTIQVRVNKRVEMSWMTGTFTWAWTTRTFTVTGWTPFVPWDVGTILTASLIETPNQTAWISWYTSSSVVTVILTDSWYVNESNVALNAIYYLLFNSWETIDITGPSPVLYTKKVTQTSFACNETDRLVVAYFAKTTSWTARTISLYYWGTTAYSNIETPINTNHNDLWWLNEWEFIHLTTAQVNNLNNQSWVNTGNQTMSNGTPVTATQWQTVFVAPIYVIWNNKLEVYLNWLLQEITQDYNETSTTSITFVTWLLAWDRVTYKLLS